MRIALGANIKAKVPGKALVWNDIRLGVILLFLSSVSCMATAQNPKPPSEWAPRFTTAGIEFKLEELERTTAPAGPSVTYSFRFSGFPKGKTYALWAKWLDGSTARFGEFEVDDTGDLVGTVAKDPRPVRMSKHTLHLSRMHKGEPIAYALVSTDPAQTIKAFASVVPFPIRAAGNGECSLYLQLLSTQGRPFGLFGEGFKPNEKLSTVSRSWPEVLKGSAEANADGKFGSILDPGVIGQTGGTASFTAAGESCEVTLQYDWGTAMKRQ